MPDDLPVLDRAELLAEELGVSGLQRAGGLIYEEFLPELAGPLGMRVYREMGDNDPVIGASLLTFDLQARQVDFTMRPVDETNAAAEAADFVWGCLNDTETSWSDTLSGIMSMIQYGWSWYLPTYKARPDGKIGWKDLAPRGQQSLVEWLYDPADRDHLLGWRQIDYLGGTTWDLPRNRSLHFRTTARLNNPEGRSCLRNAYVPWRRKWRIEEHEMVGIERDLVGLPVATLPESYLHAGASAKDKAIAQMMRDLVRTVRRNEGEGVLLPGDLDPTTNAPNFTLKLMNSGGARQFDLDKTIARYDARILLTMLTDFLLLGHEGTAGGFGITNTNPKMMLFATALSSYLDGIVAQFNRWAIPTLCALNGIRLVPTMEHGPVQRASLLEIIEVISKLAGAGAPLFPDDILLGHVLSEAGLPSDRALVGEEL